ncbi:MAG: hypothetical protein FWD36_10000 [Treponema sp.]|nr:hypothetical protein [Treponema sp.]
MTITQTIDIPADRRVFFDFPREVPMGKAQVELRVIPFVKNSDKAVENTSECSTPHTDALLSIFSKISDVNLEEIRNERMARHLK